MASAAVASLDFLLRHPNALHAEPTDPKPCDRLYIPRSYIGLLANIPREEHRWFPNRQTLLRALTELLQQMDCDTAEQVFQTQNGLHVSLITADPTAADPNPQLGAPSIPSTPMASSHQQALAAAKQLSTNYPHIPIFTYDPGLQALAALSGIPTSQPDLAPPYSGRRTVHLSDNALVRLEEASHHPVTLTTWEQQIDPHAPLFRPNEFIEIANPPPLRPARVTETNASPEPSPEDDEKAPEPFPAFRRFDAQANIIVPLKYQSFTHPKCAEIHPRTAGQRFLLEALLAPADEIPIVIVQGEFGTGKTFLSIAAAYDGVTTKRYSSVVVCPRDSRLGDDIGALPGDSDEKTRTKALGFTDNLYQVIKIAEKIPVTPKAHSTAKSRMEEFIHESVEFVPLVEMGGRSLSERFAIYDEFQDVTPSQARALITRLGDRSKMVIMGDLSQVNNPKLSRSHNGLQYLLDRLAGKAPGVAVVTLTADEIVRHPLLLQIASFL